MGLANYLVQLLFLLNIINIVYTQYPNCNYNNVYLSGLYDDLVSCSGVPALVTYNFTIASSQPMNVAYYGCNGWTSTNPFQLCNAVQQCTQIQYLSCGASDLVTHIQSSNSINADFFVSLSITNSQCPSNTNMTCNGSGCTWCPTDNTCRDPSYICPSCTTFTSVTECNGYQCNWCSVGEICQAPSTCQRSTICEQFSYNSTLCTFGNNGCVWCVKTNTCEESLCRVSTAAINEIFPKIIIIGLFIIYFLRSQQSF